MCAVPVGKKCEAIGCSKLAVAKGLCDMHRKRLARHGTIDDEVGRLMIEGYVKLEHHPLYETWRNFTRSNLGKDVCDEWKSFANFVKDVGNKPDGDFRFVRHDSKQPYSIENCYWQEFERGSAKSENKKEYMRKYAQKLRNQNPDYFLNADLKRNYGITLDDFYKILESQNGVCKICKKPEKRRDKSGNLMRLHVDHCHKTHKVRGLLCQSCNSGLGKFKDNVDYLKTAIAYLEASK